MMESSPKRLVTLLVAMLFVLAATMSFVPSADALRFGGGGFRAGGGSFRLGGAGFRTGGYHFKGTSSWWSGASRAVWGSRSGGGIYKKPSSVKPSQSYGKPSFGPGASGAYSKPSLEQRSSNQYSKPSSGVGKETSGSYAKPKVGTPGATVPSTFTGGSKFDRKMVQQMKQQRAKASLDSYRAETGKFQKTAGAPWESYKSSPVYNKVHNYGGFDYRAHYDRRDSFYRGMGWSPPRFAYGMAPSYGIWDTLFWFMILDHFHNRNYAATAYNHANDPGYQAWRRRRGQSGKE